MNIPNYHSAFHHHALAHSPFNSPLNPAAATAKRSPDHILPSLASMSLRSASPADRDLETQRRLLGEDAFELLPPGSHDQLATPSPLLHQTSPLSVASHLEDEFDEELLLNDPFLVSASDQVIGSPHWSASASSTLAPYTAFETATKSPKRKSHKMANDDKHDSALGLDLISQPHHQLHHTNSDPVVHVSDDLYMKSSSSSRSRAATVPSNLPTIQEIISTADKRPKRAPRQPLFPLGPPPQPPPPRRPRYDPPPHIVDIAIEHLRRQSNGDSPNFNLRPISPVDPTPIQQRKRSVFSTRRYEDSDTDLSQLNQYSPEAERERQWKIWEMERLRALEMTKEASKGNRPLWGAAPETKSEQPATSTAPKKRRWWCFGGGVTEDQVADETVTTTGFSRVSSIGQDDEETRGFAYGDNYRGRPGPFKSIGRKLKRREHGSR